MADKKDGLLYDFTRQFADSLATEWRFVEDISHGLAQSRPDAVQRHLNQLFSAVNVVVSNASPFGSGVVSFLTGQIERYMQNKNNKKSEKQTSELSKHSADKRNLLFLQIATEVMYRYGASIYQFIEMAGSESSAVALDRLARTGAIRIIYSALKRNIGFEHCEKLVKGMVEGFDGFPECDVLSKLTEGALNVFDSNRRSTVLRCEGLYTRCGYMTPGSQFWIHPDFDRQKGVKGCVGGYVTFVNPVTGSGLHREDRLVPKYGYIASPSSKEPGAVDFRRHRPTAAENVHVSVAMKFRYRYVSNEHIVDYLTSMKAIVNKSPRPDFNTWLSTGAHSKEFTIAQGLVKALFRGIIDMRLLSQANVDFSDGNFSNVDFSYSTFRKLTLGNFQKARLLGCTFESCTATGAAISGADLSLSTIDRCTFEGLNGIITLNYGVLVNTSFAGSTFTVSSFEGMEYDDKTLHSFSTSFAKSASGSSGPDEQLYQLLLETKLKQEEMAALIKERDEAMRQAETDRLNNRDLLNTLMASDSKKDIKHTQRVMSVEAQITLLSRRLDAIDKNTLPQSLEMIKPLPASDENPIAKIFEVLFFLKPVKLLKLLLNRPDAVQWHTLPRLYTYSTSGVDGTPGTAGEHGLPGGAGGGAGTDAVSGVNGQHGTSAAPNTVCLMSVPGQRVFIASPKANDADATILPLYDGKVRVNLYARGGNGGKGGDGGNGGNGANGTDGRNATSSGAGTSGTGGGNGGRGGNGGMGGNAGHSADITVLVKEHDMDLLSLLGVLSHEKPKGGAKGNFGLGGSGGQGGRGGRSYSGYDGERHYTNPGGQNGPNGVAGMNGRDGQTGQDGVAGNLVINVVNAETGEIEEYSSVYKFQLSSIAPFYSTTGIIEPGQQVKVSSFVLSNIGGMPSPATALIVTMKGNSLLVVEEQFSSWTVREKVLPNKTLEVAEPLPFTIAEGLKSPFPEDTLQLSTELTMTGRFPRTNVEFADFQKDKIPLSITHPLDISIVAGSRATVFDWQVPITITLRNKARVAFGLTAAYGRLVRVTVQLEGLHEHAYYTNVSGLGSNLTFFSTASAVHYDIDFIAPQSEMVLSGTLSVCPQHAKLYDQLRLHYTLSLGAIDNPLQQSALEVLQSKSHTLQVAEYCTPITATDCMLIVSGSTTAAEIEVWRKSFTNLGYTMCVFNVALYHGASYKFPAFNVCQELSGRIVVILNSPFYRDDNIALLHKEFYPLDFLEQSEMFEAARRHSVRTFIVNYSTPAVPVSTHHKQFLRYICPWANLPVDKAVRDAEAFDGRNIFYEHLRDAGVTRDEKLPEKYQYCRIKLFRVLFSPKESDFDNRMVALSDKIKQSRPDRTYLVSKAYEPAVLGGMSKALLFRRYDCGHIEIRRGLDTTYAVIASTSVARARPSSTVVNEFVLLKLLPLSTKLALFTSISPSAHAHYQVSLAIISDIADEQNVFLNCVREQMVIWGEKKNLLSGWLVALNTLEKFDFSDLVHINGGVEVLTNLLLKLCCMASQYNKAHMIKSSFLARAVLDACFALMTSYLGVAEEEVFKQKVADFNAQQLLSKDDNLVAKYMDPHDCAHEVAFNHWMPIANNVVSGHQTPNQPSSLSIMRTELPNMAEEGLYKKAVSFFSQSPLFHVQKPPVLYPVHPSEEVERETPGRLSSYFARGQITATTATSEL